MRFTKMHGAGNDYVYVDCFREPVPDDPPEIARQIADRHYGVGGDGLILICPSKLADARMRMFNADGSEAEMCGNGIRCVAKYVYDHAICQRPTLRIETAAGILAVELEIADGLVERVRVDMGRPILEPAKIPVELPGSSAENRLVNFPLDRHVRLDAAPWIGDCGLDRRMTCVSMGNPHVIIYCEHVAAVPLATIGPLMEGAGDFSDANQRALRRSALAGRSDIAHVGTRLGHHARLRHRRERCVRRRSARGRTDRTILAHLPGGDLELEWAENEHVYMTGPAVEVFSGDWSPGVVAEAAIRRQRDETLSPHGERVG